jgi:hypothetical protein
VCSEQGAIELNEGSAPIVKALEILQVEYGCLRDRVNGGESENPHDQT